MTAEALADYFSRISYTGPAEPTLDVLTALVAAHNRSIPFENLDPLMGVPVADLGTDVLLGKLVGRRRGGYCYEQNGLMEYVLSQLGFGVDALGGRVVWMNTSAHAARSDPSDAGGDGARRRRPLPRRRRVRRPDAVLADPVGGRHVQQTRHEPYRLREHDDGYLLESEIRGDWEPLYMFTTRPQPLIDRRGRKLVCLNVSGVGFRHRALRALVTDDARWNLRGRNLAIHREGETERIRFDTAAQVLEALTERFGIDLDGLGDVEARVNQVLDS